MPESVRLDKWLWAARFFKTRSLATEAVSGGKVHLNGGRIKPAKAVKIGDSLRIRRLDDEYVVHVEGIADKRGPAKIAQTLYTETDESIALREKLREGRRTQAMKNPAPPKRPDKRSRRLIHRFKQQ